MFEINQRGLNNINGWSLMFLVIIIRFFLPSIGIAWSFRFPSLSSLSRRKMPLSPRPHLDVRQWLNVLDLGQYASVFEKFEGVEVSSEQTFFNNVHNNNNNNKINNNVLTSSDLQIRLSTSLTCNFFAEIKACLPFR
jgi:hypothetical protein